MTIDKKVVTPNDMGTGLIYDDTAQQFKAVSQVAFQSNAATVDFMFNGIQLIFRQITNSNRPMVCTGVLYQGKWYGDSPNDKSYIDPFTNLEYNGLKPIDDIYAKKNGDEAFNSVNLGDYGIKTKKVTLTAPALRRTATVDTGIQWDKYVSISARVQVSDTSAEIFNSISYEVTKGSTVLTVTNSATNRFDGKPMTLFITYEV